MSTTRLKQYQVFGLIIHSEITLKELIAVKGSAAADIILRHGQVISPPSGLPNTIYRQNVILGRDMFYLNLENYARFIVNRDRERTRITIDVLNEPEMNTILTWFYGSVLTAALQMNDRFALHASAVLADDRLHLFCGPSGIGKSTIAAHLHTLGYQVFSDDKCVLIWDDKEQKYMAEPSIQIMRLWEDASTLMTNDDFLENPTPVVNRMNKYQFNIKTDNMIVDRKPIGHIYIIKNTQVDSQLQVFEPKGFRKAKFLQNQTHRKSYLEGLGKTRAHWAHMDRLVTKVPVSILRRPQKTSIHDFVTFVVKHLDTKSKSIH